MSFIEFQHISYSYNQGLETEHRALEDVSAAIEEGTFVAILGTNGSGKSTLAKHINGLLLPTEGKCLIDGNDTSNPEELWEARQQVGMVFQNPDNQLIAAVVEDDVAFGPENLGVPPETIRKRVHEALESVQMMPFRTFAPHLLSGGQKQRIAIAGALAMHPRCLVLDEPTAMLDPQGRREVLKTVKKLHQEGMTIVYITHFMEEAAAADRLLLMHEGKLIDDGVPRRLFQNIHQMKKMGLEVPLAVEMAEKLRETGIKLPKEIFTDEELCQALEEYACQ